MSYAFFLKVVWAFLWYFLVCFIALCEATWKPFRPHQGIMTKTMMCLKCDVAVDLQKQKEMNAIMQKRRKKRMASSSSKEIPLNSGPRFSPSGEHAVTHDDSNASRDCKGRDPASRKSSNVWQDLAHRNAARVHRSTLP